MFVPTSQKWWEAPLPESKSLPVRSQYLYILLFASQYCAVVVQKNT